MSCVQWVKVRGDSFIGGFVDHFWE
jgi:hypothetical protein